MPYSALAPEHIVATAERLQRRVEERFPGSGLSGVAAELASISRSAGDEAGMLNRPVWWLRIFVGAIIVGGAGVFFFIGRFLTFDRISSGAFDFVQGIEAVINTGVLGGIGLITLIRLEERVKRERVLKGLHRLRSLIHIIDMHQLTKDPAAMVEGVKRTSSSPERKMGRPDLLRYLDYCSEMLSLTGKLAALYAQSVPDMEVVNAVNDVENLGANLSRKIWQKMTLLIPQGGSAPRG
ncbi:MAG: hypothetical protein H6888_11265 [Nitratireductor sp.]|nr:hypothetical protein [Nitratireductor sp.]MCC0021635.1 hypothetical protein [Nitratireductor sp.]